MVSITLREADKQYGNVHAVRSLSMEIADGEFVAFLGPSGCGKSSTMRMIAGLEEITGGDILFDGASVIARAPGQRNVAMAFENYALYPTLTVFENLAFPLRSAGVAKPEIDRRVHEIAEVSGLTPILGERTTGLSSGQAQAVGLARALVRKPGVLLLDEPISHLDTTRRFAMRSYIKRLHIELGHTMILVTHDQEDAMSLADRVAVMEMGQLRQMATPLEIYTTPADSFVAGFVGDIPMNFLPCAPVNDLGERYVAGAGWSLPLPQRYRSARLPERLLLGIRPYDISLAGAGDGVLGAEVVAVEYLGDMNLVLCAVGDNRLQLAAGVTVRPAQGAAVGLHLNPAKTLLFDAETGSAIVPQHTESDGAAQ